MKGLLMLAALLGLAFAAAIPFEVRAPAPVDDKLHAVANTYFRLGQEAAILALFKQERIKREVNVRYGYFEPIGPQYTNYQDFEAVSNPITIIDDPRIFDAVLLITGGDMLGLDTNSWAGYSNGATNRPAHTWMVLKK